MLKKHAIAQFYDGSRATLLIDGPATFEAMRKAIQGAAHHIHLEIYIFKDDSLGRQIADMLVKKQKEGVQVRIIYDAVGARFAPGSFFDHLGQHGVQLLKFHPVNPFQALHGWHPDNLDHRKMLIIDGLIAFTRGMNISSSYSMSSLQRNPGRGSIRLNAPGGIRASRLREPPSLVSSGCS